MKQITIRGSVNKCVTVGFPHIVTLTRQVKDAGAKYITSTNMTTGFAPPDIYKDGKPKIPFLEAQPLGGVAGNCVRHILYKHVASISRFVPEVDIIATGGLCCPEHFIEALMFGAQVTGTCAGIYFKGLSLIRKSVQFMKKYMADQGYDNVTQFRGLAVKHIKYPEEIDWKVGKLYVETDPVRCNGCALCTDTLCDATYMEDGVAKVRREDCSGSWNPESPIF